MALRHAVGECEGWARYHRAKHNEEKAQYWYDLAQRYSGALVRDEQQRADTDPDGDHANEDQKRPAAAAMTQAQALAFHEMAGLLNDLRFQPELTNALWARIDLAHKHALAAMPVGAGVVS